jgi:hypothetical protein
MSKIRVDNIGNIDDNVNFEVDKVVNIAGKFADGFVFRSEGQIGITPDGQWWSYNGSLPFTVTAGTVPSEPTYTNRGDAALRSALADPDSDVPIAGVPARNLVYGLTYVTPKMFGAKGDASEVTGLGTDDSDAVIAAIRFCEENNVKLVLDTKYLCTKEICVRKKIDIEGNGAGNGYGDVALTQYSMKSGLVFNGTGPKRVRTRVKFRATEADPSDDPISVGLNIQAEYVSLKDFCVYLWFDRTDNSPTNLGANWDVGLFNGCRVHMSMDKVHVLGYWREACAWVDVTRASNLPEFDDPDGNPYLVGTVNNGCDGLTINKCYLRGSKWALRIQGARPKSGELTYSDPYLGIGPSDGRGRFGASDVTVIASSLYGAEHHSNRRTFDITGNTADENQAGVMWIDGLSSNLSNKIQGMRFFSTRFASFEAFRVKLGNVNRPQFHGCHIEPRPGGGRMDALGNLIDTGDYTTPISYGQVAVDSSASMGPDNVVFVGMQGTINKTWLPQTLMDELCGANNSGLKTRGNIDILNGNSIVCETSGGSLDLRGGSAGEVRLRVGAITKLIAGNTETTTNQLIRPNTNNSLNLGTTTSHFKDIFGYSLQNRFGELDLRSAEGTGVRLRTGANTRFRYDQTLDKTFMFGVAVRPNADNVTSLGEALNRWTEVFAANSTINTSDARLKTNERLLSDAEIKAWSKVSPKIFQWIASVEIKGEDDARLNAGWLAQDVESAFRSEGLDPSRYALWCKDFKKEVVTKTREVIKPKMVTVDSVVDVVTIVDGKAVLSKVKQQTLVQEVIEYPLFDESGNPLVERSGEQDSEGNDLYIQSVHREPQFETVVEEYQEEVETDDYVLGLRPSQCLVFESAYLRSIAKMQ